MLDRTNNSDISLKNHLQNSVQNRKSMFKSKDEHDSPPKQRLTNLSQVINKTLESAASDVSAQISSQPKLANVYDS